MKNFKLNVVVVVCLIIGLGVSGCVWQSADMTDILKAQQFCSDKGGLREIDIVFDGAEKAFCINGDETYLSNVKLKIAGEETDT